MSDDDVQPNGAFFSVASVDGEHFIDAKTNDVIISASSGTDNENIGHRNLLFGFDNNNNDSSSVRKSTLRLEENQNNVSVERLSVSSDMFLTGMGSLGIGTSDPRAKLDVRGNEVRLQGRGDTRYLAFTSNLTGAAGVTCVSSTDLQDSSNTFEVGCSPSRNAFLRYNGMDRLTLDRRGFVGIGTASPRYRLEVIGEAHVTGAFSSSNLTVDGRFFELDSSDPTFHVIGTRSRDYKHIARFTSKEEGQQYSEARTVLAVDGNDGGRVGVNVDDPQHALEVHGDVFTTGQYLMSSDARLKHDVRVITSAVDKLRNMSGYTFRREADEGRERQRQAGFLAQEVEASLPEAVRRDDRGYLSVSYADVMALVVEALKEVSDKVDAMVEKGNP